MYQYECSSPVLAPVGCLQYFLSVTGVVESFNYKVGVYQYECSSPVLALVGCLQYFLSVTGVVESFNYKVGVSVKLPQPRGAKLKKGVGRDRSSCLAYLDMEVLVLCRA